jgi:NUMOD3 motif
VNQFYTYLYRDPKDDTPIYVGKGTGKRAWAHQRTKSHIGNVIRKRKREGYTVEPIINYEVDEATAHHMEMFWIDFYGRADLGKGTLFNRTDGGEGLANPSEGTRAKISAAAFGRQPMSNEVKAKINAARKGKPGKPHTEETKAKISAGHIGKIISDESKIKMSQSAKKRPPVSEETKAKLSAARKGKPGHNKGIPRSAETREKISATLKRRAKEKRM